MERLNWRGNCSFTSQELKDIFFCSFSQIKIENFTYAKPLKYIYLLPKGIKTRKKKREEQSEK